MKVIRTLLIIFILFSFSLTAFSQENVKAKIYPHWIGQGQTFIMKIFPKKEIVSGYGEAFGERFSFFRLSDSFRGVVGVPVDAAVGMHKIELFIEYRDGTKVTEDHYVEIKRSKFPKVSFWLNPDKKQLLSPQLVEEEWAQIEKEVVKATLQQLWKGYFMKPAWGRYSMTFGMRQMINGKLSGQHRGLDIAGKANYKIFAANNGRVVFTSYLRAFGNTIVIDHGQGVFSLYFHLSKIGVKKNDDLKRGAVIGRMGSTGVATGVHLHFAMSVNNVRVDPTQWLNGVIM